MAKADVSPGNPLRASALAVACPYLGLQDDPRGYHSYPSLGNRCFHSRWPAIPLLAHQEAYCLRGAHKDCPVYWQPRKRPFPSSLKAAQTARAGRSAALITALAVVIGLAVMGFAASRFFPVNLGAPRLIPVTGASLAAAMTPSSMALQSPTATATAPTPTPKPTGTAVPQAHALEMPFDVDGHTLLMHRVTAGDMFDTIDAQFETTPEVLRALNYSLTGSLLANTVIVIAPGLQTVDPALPSFKVRAVTGDATTIGDLAVQYHVEPALLGHYNGCAADCSVPVGDWILVPVIQSSTVVP